MMKVFFLIILSFWLLTSCSSVSHYIKTRKSQYLYSEDLGNLKLPRGLHLPEQGCPIPEKTGKRPTDVPYLYPPVDEL
jgi:uncharacterized lipoprotein